MPGILDMLSAPANPGNTGTGFPFAQQASPFASLLQGLGSINFAHIPQRPQPDVSALHPLAAQLMGRLIAPPVPLPQIQLPSTHIPSAAQTMQTAAGISAGQTPFGPGPWARPQ
jgi:hypothetical protein